VPPSTAMQPIWPNRPRGVTGCRSHLVRVRVRVRVRGRGRGRVRGRG
jgi:hypothetical protein